MRMWMPCVICVVLMSVLSCQPVEQTLAELKGPSSFTDVTHSVFDPPPIVSGWPGLALFDYDNDGDIDVFITNAPNLSNHLYRNDGSTFTDVATEAGVPIPADGTVAVGVGDFDNDGWLDMVLGRQIDQSGLEDRSSMRYMKNLGPDDNGIVRFGEGTEPTGLADVDFAMSIGVGDIDNDGLLDLYIGRYDLRDAVFEFGSYLPDTPNVLLRNTRIQDGVPIFEDITEDAGVAGTAVAGLASDTADIVNRVPTWAVYMTDVNDDGLQDIFSLQEIPGGVDLFVNNGDLTFTSAQADLLNKHGGWMGIAGSDFDRDGSIDYFLTNVGADAQLNPVGGSTHIANSFALENGTPFHRLLAGDASGVLTDVIADVSVTEGLLPPTNVLRGQGLAAYEFGFGCAWLDVDNDGWDDLTWIGDLVYFDVLGDGPLRVDFHGVGRFLKNQGGMTFIDETPERGLFYWDDSLPLSYGYSLLGRALAAIDLNGDGYADISRTNSTSGSGGFQCLFNPATEPGNWLTVRLSGTSSNRFGIGARVAVEAGDARYVSEVITTTSAFTAVHPQAHFGLGNATAVDKIIVSWPSGIQTVTEGVNTNQVITLDEDSG